MIAYDIPSSQPHCMRSCVPGNGSLMRYFIIGVLITGMISYSIMFIVFLKLDNTPDAIDELTTRNVEDHHVPYPRIWKRYIVIDEALLSRKGDDPENIKALGLKLAMEQFGIEYDKHLDLIQFNDNGLLEAEGSNTTRVKNITDRILLPEQPEEVKIELDQNVRDEIQQLITAYNFNKNNKIDSEYKRKMGKGMLDKQRFDTVKSKNPLRTSDSLDAGERASIPEDDQNLSNANNLLERVEGASILAENSQLSEDLALKLMAILSNDKIDELKAVSNNRHRDPDVTKSNEYFTHAKNNHRNKRLKNENSNSNKNHHERRKSGPRNSNQPKVKSKTSYKDKESSSPRRKRIIKHSEY